MYVVKIYLIYIVLYKINLIFIFIYGLDFLIDLYLLCNGLNGIGFVVII